MPFVLGGTGARRFAAGVVAVAIAAIAANGVLYGLPVPYAGYLYGTAAAQALEGQSSITPFVWVALPAMLFDRTFGLAGSAPWVFLGLLGAAPALRARRDLVPAAATVLASLAALSLFRYWEGGYAPPNRYVVDVLPLAAPFVAYGLLAAREAWLRVTAGVLVGMSLLAGLVIAAVPLRALNSAYEHKLQDVYTAALGVNPLAWLPSFQPTTPDWWIAAYLRLVPALLAAALLVWIGVAKRVEQERAQKEGA